MKWSKTGNPTEIARLYDLLGTGPISSANASRWGSKPRTIFSGLRILVACALVQMIERVDEPLKDLRHRRGGVLGAVAANDRIGFNSGHKKSAQAFRAVVRVRKSDARAEVFRSTSTASERHRKD